MADTDPVKLPEVPKVELPPPTTFDWRGDRQEPYWNETAMRVYGDARAWAIGSAFAERIAALEADLREAHDELESVRRVTDRAQAAEAARDAAIHMANDRHTQLSALRHDHRLEVDSLRSERDAARSKVRELEAENFTLAARVCPKGFGDEGGTPQCCAAERIRELEEEVLFLQTELACLRREEA